MSHSNKDWYNEMKNTNKNINEINSGFILTLENLEKENVKINKNKIK